MEREISTTARPQFHARHSYVAIIGTDSSYRLHWVNRDGTIDERPTRQGRWAPTRPWCGSIVTGDGEPTFTRHVFRCRSFEHVAFQVAALAAEAAGLSKLAKPLRRGSDNRYRCPLCDQLFLYGPCFARHLDDHHGHEALSMMVVHSAPPNNGNKRKGMKAAKT